MSHNITIVLQKCTVILHNLLQKHGTHIANTPKTVFEPHLNSTKPTAIASKLALNHTKTASNEAIFVVWKTIFAIAAIAYPIGASLSFPQDENEHNDDTAYTAIPARYHPIPPSPHNHNSGGAPPPHPVGMLHIDADHAATLPG